MSGRGRVRVEPSPKRVRALFAGEVIVDSTRPWLVWEKPFYPAYYFPADDVRTHLLQPTGRVEHSPSRGDAQLLDLVVGDRTVPDAARRFPESPIAELRDFVRFDWDAIDHWLEEDEEVFVHPRDPYKRIDVLRSTRHVVVKVDGVVVADSHAPVLLFETSLPTRYYLPLSDVNLELLERSDHTTACPYKGTAGYYSVRVGDALHENLVWTYPTAHPEVHKVAGLLAFYHERAEILVDGERVEGS